MFFKCAVVVLRKFTMLWTIRFQTPHTLAFHGWQEREAFQWGRQQVFFPDPRSLSFIFSRLWLLTLTGCSQKQPPPPLKNALLRTQVLCLNPKRTTETGMIQLDFSNSLEIGRGKEREGHSSTQPGLHRSAQTLSEIPASPFLAPTCLYEDSAIPYAWFPPSLYSPVGPRVSPLPPWGPLDHSCFLADNFPFVPVTDTV